MALKTNTILIDDVQYELKELTIGQMMPLLPKLSGDDSMGAQLEILKLAVYKDGAPIGDAVSEFGVSNYMRLAKKVMELNNLSDEGNE